MCSDLGCFSGHKGLILIPYTNTSQDSRKEKKKREGTTNLFCKYFWGIGCIFIED